MKTIRYLVAALAIMGSAKSALANDAMTLQSPVEGLRYHNGGYMSEQKVRRIIRLYYRAFLFREAEPAGLQGHTNSILQGASFGEVAEVFGDSPEFQYTVLASHSPRSVIRNVYRVPLNREAEPAGLAHWSNMVAQGNAAGAFAGIVESEEFAAKHGL